MIGAAGVALKKFFPQLGSKMPLFGCYPYRQKLVYAGNTMQDYLATAWSERAGANAQRKHLGKGNKKTDNHRYGESLSLMRFHFIGAHSGSAGVDIQATPSQTARVGGLGRLMDSRTGRMKWIVLCVSSKTTCWQIKNAA